MFIRVQSLLRRALDVNYTRSYNRFVEVELERMNAYSFPVLPTPESASGYKSEVGPKTNYF